MTYFYQHKYDGYQFMCFYDTMHLFWFLKNKLPVEHFIINGSNSRLMERESTNEPQIRFKVSSAWKIKQKSGCSSGRWQWINKLVIFADVALLHTSIVSIFDTCDGEY